MVETLREIISIIKDVFHDKSSIKVSTRRLKQLVSLKTLKKADEDEEMKEGSDDDDVGPAGIFPDYSPILAEFEDMIVWKQYRGKKVPEPKRGVDDEFDKINVTVEEIKRRMEKYVDEVAKETGCD